VGRVAQSVQRLATVAQSVQRLATGWTVRGSNPSVGEIFCTCPDRPWGLPSLLYNGYRLIHEGRKRPGRDADPSPLLMPRSKQSRAIPLLSLRAFVACKKGETYLRMCKVSYCCPFFKKIGVCPHISVKVTKTKFH
jgi:hypothetical protein